MGLKVATLEIDVTAPTTRVVGDLATIKRASGETMGEVVKQQDAAARSAARFARSIAAEREVFGMTAAEVRQYRAALAAVNAEKAGRTDMAAQIRADAAAVRDAADAAAKAATEETRLAQAAKAAAEAEAALARAAASAARERQAAIAAADQYAGKLEAEVAALGRGTAQVRQLEIAQRALAAEQAHMPDIAARIRSAGDAMAKAAADAARLANADRVAAAEHSRLAEVVRASHAAQEADAAAARALVAAVDPLRAAHARLNAEMAEATRLYHNGALSAGEYGTAQRVLTGQLAEVQGAQAAHARSLAGAAGGARLARHDMLNLAAQINDIGVSLASGQKPLTVFIQQGAQIGQLAANSGVGLLGMVKSVGALFLVTRTAAGAADAHAAAMARLAVAEAASAAGGAAAAGAALELAAAEEAATVATNQLAAAQTRMLAPWAALLIGLGAAASVAGVAFWRWKEATDDDAHLKAYAASLGLTHKEMKKLGDVSVTTGDMIKGVFKAVSGDMGMDGSGKKLLDYLFSPTDAQQVATFVSEIYGVFAGGYQSIIDLWGHISTTFGGYFSQASGYAIEALKPIMSALAAVGESVSTFFGTLLQKVQAGIAYLANGASSLLKAVGLDKLAASIGAASTDAVKVVTGNFHAATAQASGALDKLAAKSAKNAAEIAKARTDAKAAEIIANRAPKKPKVDNHGATLAREAEATEAQIRNLYALAKAYGVSDAAALIAEARVKAESDAIKKRGDIEERVTRQVRLAIAQRVSDAAKATAEMMAETAAQRAVNDQVAAGLITGERAADQMREQLALRPLLAALSAAQSRNDVEGANAATAAIARQTQAQRGSVAEKIRAQLAADMAGGANQLAELREEMRLIGATDAVRVRALATLRATQEAAAKQYDPEQAKRYVAQQVAIAEGARALTAANDNFNASLTYQADLWSLIDRNAQDASRGMVEAFGAVGQAIGDVVTTLTGYASAQEQLAEARAEDLRKAGDDAEARARVEMVYARQSAGAQIDLFGNIAGAAKGFFSENSKAYKVAAAAEKAFRLAQMALAVKAAAVQLGLIGGVTTAKVAGDTAMAASDTARSVVEIANSAAAGAAKAAEAVVNAIRSMPFPLNLAAGAATAAVVASLGFAVAGAFGGGGGNSLPKANDGTGSVLGDGDAQSESIARAIEQLAEIDRVTMTHSGAMLTALRSIDQKIGGLASLVVRTGNVTGLPDMPSGAGGLLSKLFGSITKEVGAGIIANQQSLGQILSSGFDASYYSDLQKKSKFLGVTTSTKYNTTTRNADTEIEQQFSSVLRGFYDAIGAAAGPLGLATGAVEQRLRGFVVNIGKIDLKGLTGEEISERLSAVFGKAADDMARAVLPGLDAFQKVGEGLFETLVRVSTTMETVSTSLGRLGANAQGLDMASSVGLAELFGSLSDMTGAADAYYDAFFSDAEKAAQRTADMGRAFGALGLSMPNSTAAFRALVEAQDLSTAAGRSTYTTLLQLAPAFAELNPALEAVAEATSDAAAILRERMDLERQLLTLQGDTAELRRRDLAGLNEANRPLQERIWALEAEKEASDAAAQAAEAAAAAETARLQAVATERAGLEQRLLEMSGDTVAIRAAELAKLDEGNRALQQRIYALTDEAVATAAAEQARAEAAAKVEAIATERAGLEQQLLQAQGNTAALRAIELAGLDASNRAIQMRIYALADEAAATAAAEQAAAEAAARAEAVANERAGLQQRLLQLQGDTAALRATEVAGLDATNRALQRQIYALEDAQEAAKAADALRDAWSSIGDSIMDEVRRIRGLADEAGSAGYASLLGQFNAATGSARGGDQDAAKLLPGLSKSLIDAAMQVASSRQELDRIQAATASSLEETFALIQQVTTASSASTASIEAGTAAPDEQKWWQTFAAGQAATTTTTVANSNAQTSELRALRAEIAGLREDTRSGDAAIAGGVGRIDRNIDRVVTAGGGNAIATVQEAA